jgi:hypothetical protein
MCGHFFRLMGRLPVSRREKGNRLAHDLILPLLGELYLESVTLTFCLFRDLLANRKELSEGAEGIC